MFHCKESTSSYFVSTSFQSVHNAIVLWIEMCKMRERSEEGPVSLYLSLASNASYCVLFVVVQRWLTTQNKTRSWNVISEIIRTTFKPRLRSSIGCLLWIVRRILLIRVMHPLFITLRHCQWIIDDVSVFVVALTNPPSDGFSFVRKDFITLPIDTGAQQTLVSDIRRTLREKQLRFTRIVSLRTF